MTNLVKFKRTVAVFLAAFMLLPFFTVRTQAADGEITEADIYVLNRDSNGGHLYFYQSACVLSKSLLGYPGGTGAPSQVFVYSMYNSVDNTYIPAYCCDIDTTAVAGSNYRRVNLEDSSFSRNSAAMIRAILEEGFYILPIDGESDADHAARANAKVDALEKAAGLPEGDLTITEAIAATQAAIWKAIHGSDLEFHTFCRQSLVYNIYSSNTKYASLCNRNTIYHKTNAAINATIEAAYNYLLTLDPIEATEKVVSPSSFVELHDPVFTKNSDGTYDVSVTAKVDVMMAEGDTLSVKASLNNAYVSKVELVNGVQEITMTLDHVPESYFGKDVTLSISGYQTAKGYFYFDAEGDRGSSQSMVGYMDSRLPVYAEVTAKEDRVINIYKSTNVPAGNGTYENKPLANIAFDIIPVATKEEYESGAVVLPDAADYEYPSKVDYILTTDKDGKASMNLLHYGLPDGVYLIAEHAHPSIVAPIEPFYLHIPYTDPETGEEIYNITITPENEVKGSVHIEKNVGDIGSNKASFGVYEPHEWIIGTTVPEDIALGLSYVITDTLDAKLDFLGGVSVVLEKNGEAVKTLAADTDYTLTVTDVDSLAEDKPSDFFAVSLTEAGMIGISDLIGADNFNDYLLRVYFRAQVNANAGVGTQIPNQAILEYVNAVNFEFVEKSEISTVYTGGLSALKVDWSNLANTLSGATFELYRLATEQEIAEAVPGLTQIPGAAGTVIPVSFYDSEDLTKAKVTSATTGEDGIITLCGIAAGKYYLWETAAPSGYTLLGVALEVTVDETSHLEENRVIVTNSMFTLLPKTGGPGTVLILTVGGALIVASAVLLFTKIYTTRTPHDDESI